MPLPPIPDEVWDALNDYLQDRPGDWHGSLEDAAWPLLYARAMSDAGVELQVQAKQRFIQHGPHDVYGMALWDAACHVVEKMGDGRWRWEEVSAERADEAWK